MHFEKRFQPELCASDDMTRENLAHAYLDTQAKRLIATDGHMLVSLACVPEDHDTSGPIQAEALKQSRKLARKADTATIQANGNVALSDGSTMIRPEITPFPDYNQVIPGFKPGDSGTITLQFNPYLLLDLAKAMGVDRRSGVSVTVQISPTKATQADVTPILVTSGHPEDAIGVLMPMRF